MSQKVFFFFLTLHLLLIHVFTSFIQSLSYGMNVARVAVVLCPSIHFILNLSYKYKTNKGVPDEVVQRATTIAEDFGKYLHASLGGTEQDGIGSEKEKEREKEKEEETEEEKEKEVVVALNEGDISKFVALVECLGGTPSSSTNGGASPQASKSVLAKFAEITSLWTG